MRTVTPASAARVNNVRLIPRCQFYNYMAQREQHLRLRDPLVFFGPMTAAISSLPMTCCNACWPSC